MKYLSGLTIVLPHYYIPRFLNRGASSGAKFAGAAARKLVQSGGTPQAELSRRASPISESSDEAFEGASRATSSSGLGAVRKFPFEGAQFLETKVVNASWQKLNI
jgi:hypothetical protein